MQRSADARIAAICLVSQPNELAVVGKCLLPAHWLRDRGNAGMDLDIWHLFGAKMSDPMAGDSLGRERLSMGRVLPAFSSPPVGTPRKREEVPTGGQEQWFLTAADREK